MPDASFNICDLPQELHDRILEFVEPLSAIKLRQTNQYFRMNAILLEQHKAYLRENDSVYDPQLNYNEYACYQCLSIRPRPAFTKATLTKAGRGPDRRCCIECSVKINRFGPRSTYVSPGGPYMGQKVLNCPGCRRVTPDFCDSCFRCHDCNRKNANSIKIEEDTGIELIENRFCFGGPHRVDNEQSRSILAKQEDMRLGPMSSAMRWDLDRRIGADGLRTLVWSQHVQVSTVAGTRFGVQETSKHDEERPCYSDVEEYYVSDVSSLL